ncbi:hypothetical protein HGRIS_001145 [Hohenbuehelia grisea]|uniref:Uncharacterized protein n=1 Tax=Hohenbuehelia grisea TaxID=104357 RepID=A0ABR3JPF1_9AGAR
MLILVWFSSRYICYPGWWLEDAALRSSRSLPSFVVLPSFLLPSFSLRFFKRDKPTSRGSQELDGAHSTIYVGPSASGSPVVGFSGTSVLEEFADGHPDCTPSKSPSFDFVKHARHQETADSILEYYSDASGAFEAGDEKEPQDEPRDEYAAELDDLVDCASDFETTTTSSSSSSITAISASQTLESPTSERCLPFAAPSTLSQDLSLTLPNPSPRPGAEDSPRRSLPFVSSTTATPKTPLINPSHRRFPSSAKPATSVEYTSRSCCSRRITFEGRSICLPTLSEKYSSGLGSVQPNTLRQQSEIPSFHSAFWHSSHGVKYLARRRPIVDGRTFSESRLSQISCSAVYFLSTPHGIDDFLRAGRVFLQCRCSRR